MARKKGSKNRSLEERLKEAADDVDEFESLLKSARLEAEAIAEKLNKAKKAKRPSVRNISSLSDDVTSAEEEVQELKLARQKLTHLEAERKIDTLFSEEQPTTPGLEAEQETKSKKRRSPSEPRADRSPRSRVEVEVVQTRDAKEKIERVSRDIKRMDVDLKVTRNLAAHHRALIEQEELADEPEHRVIASMTAKINEVEEDIRTIERNKSAAVKILDDLKAAEAKKASAAAKSSAHKPLLISDTDLRTQIDELELGDVVSVPKSACMEVVGVIPQLIEVALTLPRVGNAPSGKINATLWDYKFPNNAEVPLCSSSPSGRLRRRYGQNWSKSVATVECPAVQTCSRPRLFVVTGCYN